MPVIQALQCTDPVYRPCVHTLCTDPEHIGERLDNATCNMKGELHFMNRLASYLGQDYRGEMTGQIRQTKSTRQHRYAAVNVNSLSASNT